MTEKSVPRICFQARNHAFLFFLFLLILQRHHKCRNQLFLSRYNTLQLAADLVDRKIFKSFFDDFLCPASIIQKLCRFFYNIGQHKEYHLDAVFSALAFHLRQKLFLDGFQLARIEGCNLADTKRNIAHDEFLKSW